MTYNFITTTVINNIPQDDRTSQRLTEKGLIDQLEEIKKQNFDISFYSNRFQSYIRCSQDGVFVKEYKIIRSPTFVATKEEYRLWLSILKPISSNI